MHSFCNSLSISHVSKGPYKILLHFVSREGTPKSHFAYSFFAQGLEWVVKLFHQFIENEMPRNYLHCISVHKNFINRTLWKCFRRCDTKTFAQVATFHVINKINTFKALLTFKLLKKRFSLCYSTIIPQ